jgi:hypothetical protein
MRRNLAEGPRDQARILRPADADRKVEAFVDEVHQPVGELDVERDLPIVAGEGREARGEFELAEAQGVSQAQATARGLRDVLHREVEALVLVEQRADAVEIGLPLPRSPRRRGWSGSGAGRRVPPPAGRRAWRPGPTRCRAARRPRRSCRSPAPPRTSGRNQAGPCLDDQDVPGAARLGAALGGRGR